MSKKLEIIEKLPCKGYDKKICPILFAKCLDMGIVEFVKKYGGFLCDKGEDGDD